MSARKPNRPRAKTLRRRPGKKSSAPASTSGDNSELLKTLTEIFHALNNVEDVLITCGEAIGAKNIEQNEEIGNVLRRGAIDPHFAQLLRLSRVIEALGGETYLTGELGD